MRDLLTTFAHLRENVPLSPGFRRFAPINPFENPSLRDLLTTFAHPSPPAAGRCKTQKKEMALE